MSRLHPLPVLALVGLAFVALSGAGAAQQSQDVTWVTSDDRTVHATWYGAVGGGARGIIMALHQGGSNGRAEYEPMVERLGYLGWDVVAVDLREGGDRFGGENRTASGNGDYCAALPDIRSGVSYIRARRADIPLVLFGSSYSGALALQTARYHNNDVSAVVAFSPATGEAVDGCRGEEATGGLLAPILAVRPASEMENPAVQEQMEVFEAQGHQTLVADPGVHGASMLVEERVDGDIEPTWLVVEEFLLEVGEIEGDG